MTFYKKIAGGIFDIVTAPIQRKLDTSLLAMGRMLSNQQWLMSAAANNNTTQHRGY
jgi:hypothetical protein